MLCVYFTALIIDTSPPQGPVLVISQHCLLVEQVLLQTDDINWYAS